MAQVLTRRRIFSAVAGAASTLVGADRAGALTSEWAPPDVRAQLMARCEGPAAHERLVEQILATLGVDGARAQVLSRPCPICGCSLRPIGGEASTPR